MGTAIITQEGASHPESQDKADKAKEILDLATRELDMLLEQRAEIGRKVRRARRLIQALATSFDECVVPERFRDVKLRRLPVRDRALTEACRTALRQTDLPLTLDQIRDGLRFQGLVFEPNRDPLMAIARVLKRMVRSGEARTQIGAAGKRTWLLTQVSTQGAHRAPQVRRPNAN